MKRKKRMDRITQITVWIAIGIWSFIELFQPGNGLAIRLIGVLGFLCVGLSITRAVRRRRQRLSETPSAY